MGSNVNVPVLAAVGCLAVTLVLLLLSTDTVAVFTRCQHPVPAAAAHAHQDSSSVAEALHLRGALTAAIQANMALLSRHAELALSPDQRSTYWASMGHIGQVPNEVTDYARLATLPGMRTLCEVGFNAGHSASVFLTANPTAVLYTFDFGELAYSSLSIGLFRAAYPKRFHWIRGSSFDSVVWFRSLNITCDLFSIDGDHGYDGAFTDMLNALKVVRVGSVIVADDISNRSPGAKKAWEEVVSAGYLKDVACADNGPEAEVVNTEAGVKRWCWGTVATLTGPLDTKQAPAKPNQAKMATMQIDPALPAVGQVTSVGRRRA